MFRTTRIVPRAEELRVVQPRLPCRPAAATSSIVNRALDHVSCSRGNREEYVVSDRRFEGVTLSAPGNLRRRLNRIARQNVMALRVEYFQPRAERLLLGRTGHDLDLADERTESARSLPSFDTLATPHALTGHTGRRRR